MKLIIGIVFTLILFACSTKKEPTYTHGYVYDKSGSPLKGVKVEDPDNRNIFSISDDSGYFRINQIIEGGYLYVILKGKKIGSLHIVRRHPETGPNYSFVEGRKDTLFIDIQQQEVISQ